MKTSRSAGVLMSVSSLPSKFGIGGFGQECYNFIDFLVECGFHSWQVLPFNITDYANSPYGSCSAFAGNFLYIDPIELYNMGLLTDDELQLCVSKTSPYAVDYDAVKSAKTKMLNAAYSRFCNNGGTLLKTFAENHPWVQNYALYMALKKHFGNTSWTEWPEEYKNFASAVKNYSQFENAARFYIFEQYVFYTQWQKIHDYAMAKNITIIGDMPVYLALDSADVWQNPQLFLLNDDYIPKTVSGVPPDAFSTEGQYWGNPVYCWPEHKTNGFKWWVERFGGALKLYDKVRIDHFRAFASYWAIPFGSKSAKEGHWEKGPCMQLFSKIFEHFSPDLFIAEDLGCYGEDVVQLLKDTGFPAMRVIQFGFSGENSPHLPHNYQNCVAYLGTHDNNTLLGWLWEMDETTRKTVLEYCGFSGENWGEGGFKSPACRKIIETVWRSAAPLCIISFQDMCGFGKDTRMNTPGVVQNNWCFRTTADTINSVDKAYFKQINSLFFRD